MLVNCGKKKKKTALHWHCTAIACDDIGCGLRCLSPHLSGKWCNQVLRLIFCCCCHSADVCGFSIYGFQFFFFSGCWFRLLHCVHLKMKWNGLEMFLHLWAFFFALHVDVMCEMQLPSHRSISTCSVHSCNGRGNHKHQCMKFWCAVFKNPPGWSNALHRIPL